MKELKEMTFKEVWADMIPRVSRLIWKLFSIKVLIMVGAFFLVYSDKITGWEGVVLFSTIALIVIFDRDAIKFIEALKGLK